MSPFSSKNCFGKLRVRGARPRCARPSCPPGRRRGGHYTHAHLVAVHGHVPMTVDFDSSLLIALAGAVQIGMSERQDNADWPDYPCDDPTTTESKEWLDAWHKSLKGTEANSLLLGQTPLSLISISSGTDVSDLREITCRDPSKESASEMAARMKHNVTVRNALKKEKDRKAQYEAGIHAIQDGFAGKLAKCNIVYALRGTLLRAERR